MSRAVMLGSLGFVCLVVFGCAEDAPGVTSGEAKSVGGYWATTSVNNADSATFTGCSGDLSVLDGLKVLETGLRCEGSSFNWVYTFEHGDTYYEQGVAGDCVALGDPWDYMGPYLIVSGAQNGTGTSSGNNLEGQMDMSTADWSATDFYSGVKSGASTLQLEIGQVHVIDGINGSCQISPPLSLSVEVSSGRPRAGLGWFSPATGAAVYVLNQR